MIYKIQPNLFKFKQFTLDADEIEEKLGEDCLIFMDSRPTHYAPIWKTLQVEFFDEYPGGSDIKQRPDIMPDLLGKLFLNEKAFKVLAPLLETAGEFLPVKFDNQRGAIFNPLLIADELQAVDTARTTFDQWDALIAPAFIDDRLQDAPIFRTALDSFRGIYCGEAVKKAIETAGFSGVVLSEDLRDRPIE